MTYAVGALFVLAVMGLAWLSHRSGQSARGCCAPADPTHDLRMRPMMPTDGRASG